MSYWEGCPDPGAVLDGDLVDLDDARESGDGLVADTHQEDAGHDGEGGEHHAQEVHPTSAVAF